MAKAAERQAVELGKVVQKLKLQKDLVDQLTVQSKVLANISFTDYAKNFGGDAIIERFSKIQYSVTRNIDLVNNNLIY